MLNLIILTSFFSLGLFITGQNPYVLCGVRDAIATSFGGVYVSSEGEWYYQFNGFMNTLWKPFWGCPTCMSSVWGIVVYTLYIPYSLDSIYELPVLIVSSACLNFIFFNNMIKKHLLS